METLCPHPVTPYPAHGRSICVLFLCLFHPGLERGLCTPTHQQPFPALLSSASFDPFVKRLLEASEPLATLATSSPGLVTPQRLEPRGLLLGCCPGRQMVSGLIHSFTHSAFITHSQAPACEGPTQSKRQPRSLPSWSSQPILKGDGCALLIRKQASKHGPRVFTWHERPRPAQKLS